MSEMVESEMVERVAKAILLPLEDEKERAVEWASIDYVGRHFLLQQAEAAIAAMREPTEAMIERIPRGCDYPYKNECGKKAWRAMIDEALK